MIGIVVFIILFIETAVGLLNPAAVYCKELGYEYIIEETPEGQHGLCKLPGGYTADSWDFLKGKSGEEYTYCIQEGYELETIYDRDRCSHIIVDECAVCVLKDGSEVEVTKLMGLNLRAGVCGDGICVLGETYQNCPQDCPSGSFDGYCDGVEDKICDPDCLPEGDADCLVEEKEEPQAWFLTPLILAALVIVIVLVVLSKLRKGK